MKRFISIQLVVSMILVMLSTQGFVSYGSTNNEIVIDNCKEIEVNEEISFMVLFDNTYIHKFVPTVTGVYTFSFERDSWVFYMVSSLYDAQLEKIASKGNEKDSFEAALTAGSAYYLEIYTNSGDVMCGASVTAKLKEKIEVTLPPTDAPVTPTPTCLYPTDTPTPEVIITPTPTCLYPTDTPEPLKTPTPKPTENVEINESDFEYVVSDKGEVTITKYTGSDINLVVPDELGGNPVKVIGNNAFADCENLENILIPESITSIKQNAFSKICIRGIFYRGSKEEWEKIIVEDGNYYIKAALYFYNFDGQFPDGDNPVIGISAMTNYVNKDNQYAIRVGAYNLSSLENAEVILRYNPEVLKLNIEDSLMIGMENLYDGGYQLLSEGNIRIGVSRDETWIYYDNDSIIGFTLYFDVIGSGNTDFSVELTEVNYRGDSQLQVITSNFAKSVESEVAPPEPMETIKPTEEIVETVCPWAPTGDVNIDDKINAEDALLVLKHAAKIVVLSGQSLEVADTNDDDSIDAKDALEILKYAAKIE